MIFWSRDQFLFASRSSARVGTLKRVQCSQAILSLYPTILAPAMTPISPAQCPILYCCFRVNIHQVRIRLSQSLPRNHTRSRMVSRMALNTTRLLSLSSAGVFPHVVRQCQRVFILFLLRNRIPMVLSALIKPNSNSIAGWRLKQVSYAFL